MFKLVLKTAEEPETKSPTSAASWKKQESSRKMSVWITTNWKILKKIGVPNHLTCLLRNLYAGQKATEFQKNIYFCSIDYAKAFDCVDHNKLWKIFQEIGIPDHLTCLLRNLYAGQEATVRTGHGTTDWF